MFPTQPTTDDSGAVAVLVVEDNPDGRESMRMLLELLGYRTEVAGDGEEGVRRALAARPRVAVVDIGLPRLDGYEVARRVRAALGRGIFLIALTAYKGPEYRRQALAAGFDAHVGKPADWDELSPLIERAAARHTMVA